MSSIHENGILVHSKIIVKQYASIEHGLLDKVNAIVVHQTDSATIESSLNSYTKGANGAHFLIGKDGHIYQTASVKNAVITLVNSLNLDA